MAPATNVDSAVLTTLQVLPAVSIFFTGFSSDRLNGYRDSAVRQLEELESAIRVNGEEDRPGADRELRQLSLEHFRQSRRPSLLNASILFNVLILFLIAALEVRVAIDSDWRFTLRLSEVASAFWALMAILTIQIAVLCFSVLDRQRIAQALGARAGDTVWAKIAKIEQMASCSECPQEVLSSANEVIQLIPRTPWSLRLHARACICVGSESAIHQAIANLLTAAAAKTRKGNDSTAEALLLSTAWERIGKIDQAIRSMNEVVDANPEDLDVNPYLRRARLHEIDGNDELALSDYEEALLLDPLSIQPSLCMARLYMKKGENRLALTRTEEVLKLDPGNSEARHIYEELTRHSDNSPGEI